MTLPLPVGTKGKRTLGLKLQKPWVSPKFAGVGRGNGYGYHLTPQVRQRRQVTILKLYLDKKGIAHDL